MSLHVVTRAGTIIAACFGFQVYFYLFTLRTKLLYMTIEVKAFLGKYFA